MLQCPSEFGCVYFVSFCFPLVVAGPFLNSRNPTIQCLCLDQGSGCSWPEPILLMVLLLELFTANKISLSFSSLSGFLCSQLISKGVGLGQNMWYSWPGIHGEGCKLLEKWVAFLKWCGCVYLGVDIIMLLWYSSCWVWNASVSKARRRARQKLGEKSEFQCLLVMVHGKVTILCLIFLKHVAYAFYFSVNYCLWMYIFTAWEHQKHPVLYLGFTHRGRSLLETLGSLMKMVFSYKASVSAVANHGSLIPGLPESLEHRTCSPPPALPPSPPPHTFLSLV